MKTRIAIAAALLSLSLSAADRPWQQINMLSAREAAAGFRTPPPEYAMTLWWFWNGPITEASIRSDLDDVKSHGINNILIWAYYGLEVEYLSDQWFNWVRFAVAEARRRNMRVWLMDEGSYPSGFAGGKFTRDYPAQRMKALVASQPIRVKGGKAVTLDAPPQTLGAWAVEAESKREVILESAGGKLSWTPPAGKWQIQFVQWQFRTPATRYVGNPGFPKNGDYSLFDFLDPEAARRFLLLVHERYKRVIGDEFGKTVMGFMGDETDCSPIPWTERSLDEFRRVKGYDLQPHISKLLSSAPTEDARRVQADYWDVWSAMLRDSFFRVQTDWCAKNGLEYIVHLNSEDNMKGLVKVSGDYFRCMRNVQVPGVDAIWRQIWPGTVADFPKLASSAAHLFGRPRSFTESFAVYGRGLTLQQAKWVMDHQFVRGINLFQTMLYLSDSREFREYFHPPDWRMSPQWAQFKALADYSNRASYLLSIGKPAARIALFYPTANLWLGDDAADRAVLETARKLMESQRDFDFIDEQALSELPLADNYRTVLIPPGAVLSKRTIDRLRALATSGRRVIFLGRTPDLVYNRTFRDAVNPGALDWATVAPTGELPALPDSDVMLDRKAPGLRYLHRKLTDADVYFFFNEGDSPLSAKASLEGSGQAQSWDPATGEIRRMASTHLNLEPGQTRFVVVAPPSSGIGPEPRAMSRRRVLAEASGNWTLQLSTQKLTTPLKSWSELGLPGHSGVGVYRKDISLDSIPSGALMLDLGEVRYSAHLRVNGVDLGARAWGPFRWDVTKALRPGKNTVEIEVRNTAANELSGDPARLREIEQKGWLKNSYIRMYGKFDAEMVPSGLIGPVRIEIWK